jgi:hypothetical protein
MAVTPNMVDLDGDSSGILLTSDSSVVWSTNIGTLYTDSGYTTEYDGVSSRTTVYFKPFNRTVEGEVIAGGSTAYISVTGVLPEAPHYPMEWEGERPGTVISLSRSGRVRGRILGDSDYLRSFKLIFNNRTPTALEEFEDFYAFHSPHKTFKYRNLWYGIDGIFRFDSKFKGRAEGRMRGMADVAISEVPVGIDFSADLLLDTVTTTAWGAYGVTKLYRRYTGAAMRVKDALNVEMDIGFDTNGNLDVNTLSADTPHRVIKWYDQSGNGRHLIGDATLTPLFSPSELAISFSGAQFFDVPSLSGMTGGAEIFLRRKLADTWTVNGAGGAFTMGSSGQPTAISWTDGKIYDDFGSTVRKVTVGTYAENDFEVWHTYSAHSAPFSWINYMNGAPLFETNTSSVGWSSTPKIGISTSGLFNYGVMSTVILFPPNLSTADRLRIHANM